MERNTKKLVNALIEATGEECTRALLVCMAEALCDACETAGTPHLEFRTLEIKINDFYTSTFGFEEEELKARA